MGCYYTLWYNTYAFALLFYKVYTKRENAGSCNSGPERSKSERSIIHNSKSPENLRRIILEYIKNIGRRKYQRGPTRRPQAWGRTLPPGRAPVACGLPGRPPVPIFCYMEGFDLEKIRG